MKKFILLLLVFTTLPTFAQSEAYSTVLKDFQSHYNKQEPQHIFDMFDSLMQQSVNLETTQQIVTSFNNKFGKLLAFEYTSSEASAEKHIGTFEKGQLTISISLNDQNKINELLFTPFEDTSPSKFDRNTTPLALPFKGEWFTFWGGDTKAQNYHVLSRTQKHAFDFVILGSNGSTYERSGTRNEDYYAFGKYLYAVCDAEVVKVITGVRDNKPGEMNPSQAFGNCVVLKTENDEYIVYAHFEEGTLKLKEGDLVKKGQYLGNCGNSGNSSEPHLHFHIQDGPDLYSAGGVKCYFEAIKVNGTIEKDYSPAKNDRVSRID